MGVYQPDRVSSVQPGRMSAPELDEARALKLQKRREKTLERFGPLLHHVLSADEKILLATRACSPLTLGQYLTTGWILYVLKRCVLIFTTKRILHIPTTRGYAPRGCVAEINYGDIAEMKTGRFLGRTLTLQYRSGKKETFQQISAFEHRRLRELLPTIQTATGETAERQRRSLCPRCRNVLSKNQFSCRGCGLEFKNKRRAAWLSLLLPGGGYFYTRHPVMGLFDAIIETYLLVFLLAMIGAAIFSTGEDAIGAAVAAVFIGFILLMEKLVTVWHAAHFIDEFIPMEKDPQRLHVTAAATRS